MDLLFFWASKLLWLCFSPDIIFIALLILTLYFQWRKSYIKSLVLLNIVVLIVIAITLLPVGDWLLNPLETRFKPMRTLPEKVDGVIVLGGAEKIYNTFLWQQVETGDAAERFLAFMHLVKKYPDAKHVFTGGSGSLTKQKFKGANVAQLLFDQQGLDTTKIIFESESRNTYENAKHSYKLIQPRPGEQWILITSAFHMPRSVGCFNKIGWPVIPYSVDHLSKPELKFEIVFNFSGNLDRLKYAIREWVGLTAYYVTMKTSDLFPLHPLPNPEPEQPPSNEPVKEPVLPAPGTDSSSTTEPPVSEPESPSLESPMSEPESPLMEPNVSEPEMPLKDIESEPERKIL